MLWTADHVRLHLVNKLKLIYDQSVKRYYTMLLCFINIPAPCAKKASMLIPKNTSGVGILAIEVKKMEMGTQRRSYLPWIIPLARIGPNRRLRFLKGT